MMVVLKKYKSPFSKSDNELTVVKNPDDDPVALKVKARQLAQYNNVIYSRATTKSILQNRSATSD